MPRKRTTIQVYESTREELVKINGQLKARNGRPRSLEDVVLVLIKY